ncbi:MAG: glycosyltransferase family 39 protein, partial [Elusimicrobia bacterium]|nr:glycosyltransferase family 39 protein [Elusimicrobiota bacterium]
MTAIGTFLALVFVRDWAFWRYALSERGVVTGASVGTLWAHAAVPIGLTVVLAAMALACGSAILRWGQSPRSGRVRVLEGTELPLAFALGAGLFAAAVALLGAARRLDGPHLGMLLAAITSVTATQAGLLRGRRPSLGLRPGWIGVLQGLLAYSAWHTLILALAPPTEWDVLAYHLPIPKLYLSWGAIREIPWLLHSHWPHLMEAFYALPLAFREDGAAALWHGACCWALVAATWAAAREELDEKVAWIAAAAVAAQPTFLRIAGTAHSDGAMALFLFLAGWCLWRFDGSRERRWLWLGAAFSGLGASCKLFGAAPAIAWTMWLALRSRRDAALFAAASLAIVAPWYAKAWLGAGNPVWPFFSSVFGGAWGASLLEKPYLVSTRWPWPPDWELLIRYGPQWLLGPLAFLALASGRARPPRFVLFSLLPALALFPVVLRQQEAWRFLLPLFPALGMLLGWWALKARSWAAAAAVA